MHSYVSLYAVRVCTYLHDIYVYIHKIWACAHITIHTYMHTYIHTHTHTHTHTQVHLGKLAELIDIKKTGYGIIGLSCQYKVCMHVCIYACICTLASDFVFMYVCIPHDTIGLIVSNTHTHTHTHTHICVTVYLHKHVLVNIGPINAALNA